MTNVEKSKHRNVETGRNTDLPSVASAQSVVQFRPSAREFRGKNLWLDDRIEQASTTMLLRCIRGLFTAAEQDRDSAHLYCARGRKLVDILNERTSFVLPPEAPARKEGIHMGT